MGYVEKTHQIYFRKQLQNNLSEYMEKKSLPIAPS